jgi:hypothetical protein
MFRLTIVQTTDSLVEVPRYRKDYFGIRILLKSTINMFG